LTDSKSFRSIYHAYWISPSYIASHKKVLLKKWKFSWNVLNLISYSLTLTSMKTINECLSLYLANQESFIYNLLEKNQIDFDADRKEYISILEKNLVNDRNAVNTIQSVQYKFFHNFYWKTFQIVWVSKDDHLLVKQCNSRSKKTYRMHISEILNNI